MPPLPARAVPPSTTQLELARASVYALIVTRKKYGYVFSSFLLFSVLKEAMSLKIKNGLFIALVLIQSLPDHWKSGIAHRLSINTCSMCRQLFKSVLILEIW